MTVMAEPSDPWKPGISASLSKRDKGQRGLEETGVWSQHVISFRESPICKGKGQGSGSENSPNAVNEFHRIPVHTGNTFETSTRKLYRTYWSISHLYQNGKHTPHKVILFIRVLRCFDARLKLQLCFAVGTQLEVQLTHVLFKNTHKYKHTHTHTHTQWWRGRDTVMSPKLLQKGTKI